MTVVQMEIGSFAQTPYNAPLFGRIDGRVCCVGVRVDRDKHEQGYLCPLLTNHDGIIIKWPKKLARQMYGFYEIDQCAG